jgi:hypothetical protein
MEQALQTDREQIARKIDAEITKLLAETAKINDERKFNAEITKLMAETAKINAEAPKIIAETLKINREAKLYPFIAGAGAGAALLGGLIGLAKLLFS